METGATVSCSSNLAKFAINLQIMKCSITSQTKITGTL